MLGLHRDLVKLVPYDKSWVDEYNKEKKFILDVIGEYVLDIQHVGSTSIPKLMAKPIIDIAVAVESIDVLRKLIPILSSVGYDVLDSIGNKGEVLARKGSEDNRTHYVHVEVIDSEYWNNHIKFRDYLIANPQYIKEYENLKIRLSEECLDRMSYTMAKNDFIKKILKLANAKF